MRTQWIARIIMVATLALPALAQPDWTRPNWTRPSWGSPQQPTWGTRQQEWQRSRTRFNINVNLNVPSVITPSLPVAGVPSGSEAGRDLDGQVIYPAIAEVDGLLMPAKTKAPFTTAWVGYGGIEHEVSRFQVVSGPGYRWVDYSPMSALPPQAVVVGPDRDGIPLYIARGQYMGSWVAGKYRQGASSSLVPFGGRERDCYRFQLLVRD